MKKQTVIEIAIIIAMIISAILVIIVMKNTNSGKFVKVSVNLEEYGKYDLAKNQEIEIKSDNGINILKIENGVASVTSASCPDKICVNMFPISADNPGIIVCLPNKVVIEIEE